MSRAPGHPLQELIYALMWNASPFFYNLLSAAASLVAAVFFALTMKNLGIKHYLFAAFAFAFTPVVFISSAYTNDYMMAMAFVMGSFYCVTQPTLLSPPKGEKYTRVFPPLWGGLVWGGLFLGLAIGFRITSGLMLIPFCILLLPTSKGGLRAVLLLFISATVVGAATYIPVLKTYGLSFFNYNDQFPYPNLPKVFFKFTFGVFGLIGFVTICFFKLKIIFERMRSKAGMIPAEFPKNLFYASCTAIILYLFSYLRLPQKSAYLIPMIPFVILLAGMYLSGRAFQLFCVLMTLSSFLFSMNLTDPLRGSVHSPLAVTFSMAGQEIFIDPFSGPFFADRSKRLNKIAYTEKIFAKTQAEQKKTVLICGWWYNELLVRQWGEKENINVKPVFYIGREEMEKYISEGYKLYFLPEQNLYNDQYSQIQLTDSLAKPYF
jgi:hypothetical protein